MSDTDSVDQPSKIGRLAMVHEEPAEFFIDKTIGHHIMDRKRLRIFLNITEKESMSAGGLKLVLKPCEKYEAHY